VEMLLDSSRKTSTCLLKPRLAGAVGLLCVVLGIVAAMPSLLLFATPAAAGEGGAVRPAAVAFTQPITPEPAESPRPPATPQAPQAPQAGNPVPDTSAGSALVQIPVVVTESRGRYVSGLGKENFKVFEDGAEQSV